MKWRLAILCSLAISVLGSPLALEAAPRRKPATSPPVDASAKRLDLFKAVEDKQVRVVITVQGTAAGVLALTNLSTESLTIEIPLAMGATPNVPQMANQAVYLASFGTPQAPQAIAISPQWAPNAEKQSAARKSGVRSNKKKADDDAKEEKKDDDKDAKKDGAKKDDAKKDGDKKDALVATVPLPAGATQTVPLYTLGLSLEKPQATFGSFTLADLEKVSQAPELKKMIELMAQGAIPEQAAQVLAWHYNDRLGWDEMLLKGVTPAQIELGKHYADVAEGNAPAEPAPTTTRKRRR